MPCSCNPKGKLSSGDGNRRTQCQGRSGHTVRGNDDTQVDIAKLVFVDEFEFLIVECLVAQTLEHRLAKGCDNMNR